MKTIQVTLLLTAVLSSAVRGAEQGGSAAKGAFVTDQPVAGAFPLVHSATAADIFVSADDWKVAQIAAADLAADVERVTGRKPAVKQATQGLTADSVLIGTLGKSPLIDRLVKDGRLDVKDVRGQRESFVIATVADPLPGVHRVLVIAGSDRRGTAYGVYELSKRIGVSPWYWWADVTPAHRDALHVSPERLRVGPPAVKYRGIFINDEMWGIRPWAMETLAPEEGHGLGPKTYAKIFELLLRLRANYIWPAMHNGAGGTIPFNCYPQNKVVADNYAIVMGSSHIEPMLRNNISGAEWDREGGGEWDYQKNPGPIRDYWAKRLTENGRYENIYTLGMRGKDDEPMKFDGTKQGKISLMERIFADQRELLAQHVNPDPAKIPQVFIPYTEVLDLYDSGLKVPADVTICWPDDNFGYIRRLPTSAEHTRSGGSGIYYHIQWLNGATSAYTWLNTTPPALIWEEMSKAWQYGAKNLWVLNVGDIKPGEIGTEFFLDMACNPERYRHDNVREFLVQWAARDLDSRFADEIASIMEAYYRLGFTRRPEHLVQARGKNPLRYSWFSHTESNDEAMQRVDQYDAIARRAEAIYKQIPEARKDAFFQLVLYPVQCASLINRKVILADKSTRYGNQGRASASEYASKARQAAARIIELTHHYNTGLVTAGAKWNHMISPAPGPWGTQFRQFEMPPLSDVSGTGPAALAMALEGADSQILADLSVYTQGQRFVDLYNTGKGDIQWSSTSSQPWLKLSLTSGTFTTEQRLWISLDWSAVPTGEDLTAMIEVTSNAGKKSFTVPVFNPAAPARDTVTGFVESHGYVSMEAEHFTRRHEKGGATWEVIKGLGRSGDSVTVRPSTVPSRNAPEAIRSSSPSLDYDIYLFHPGEARLDIDCLPTKPVAPGQGVGLAVSLDGAAPKILTGSGGDTLANLRRMTTTVKIASPGQHTLTVMMVDPGVIIDKLVLNLIPAKDTYLGPPESYRR
ncbi:MAG: glycosyl hydrolase 115 family protein [Akkermansiaceae bacterium]|nr:glycosyl hydrolase 115 family protein [Akkermansiaceae bacterium]MCF7731484.1 glycosyl hydrolase 115 family protein [Akkermansiaceae bacterium]